MPKQEKRLQFIKMEYLRNADVIQAVLRNLDTGKKRAIPILRPEMDFYVSKKEYLLAKPVHFVPVAHVDKITCRYKTISKTIAGILFDRGIDENAVNFYKDCVGAQNFRELDRLGFNPNIHGSDANVADYYISRFLRRYPQDPAYTPTKGFYDIEVDTRGFKGFPDEKDAPCPVNAISLMNTERHIMTAWILRNEESDSCMEFLGGLKARSEKLLKALKRMTEKTKVLCPIEKVDLRVFDDELEMLKNFMNHVNEVARLDFLSAWNAHFDIFTIINRLKKLMKTDDISKVMCSADMTQKEYFYYEDNFNQDYADKGDYFSASGYSNWVDSMLIFAALRKADGKRESYMLNAIAQEELGVGKVEFAFGETLQNLPYVNFPKFMRYNLIDTFLLALMEIKNGDIDQLYTLSLKTETRMSKVLKKTTSLRNLISKFAQENGLVLSNNRNVFNKERKTFRGGFVGEPSLNSENGIEIMGRRSGFVFENVIDMDLASLYPTICILFKTDSSNQLGRICLDDKGKTLAEGGKEALFVDHMVSDDAIHTGKRYFGLPGMDELIRMFEETEE